MAPDPFIYIGAIFLVAVVVDYEVMRAIRTRRRQRGLPVPAALQVQALPGWAARPLAGLESAREAFLVRWRVVRLPLLELGLIGLWAVFVGRDYLNLDLGYMPYGREFGSAIQTHYVWKTLFQCGACVFWDGQINGGAPAFADVFGSTLYPPVILSTLIWGVLSGAKIVLVFCLAMAGIAQWWLAKLMRLGWVGRLWSALMVVVGGHLAGRMELGAFGVLVSVAACSLVLPAIVWVAQTGSRKAAVALGVILGLALLSGQGYVQITMALSYFPACLILVLDGKLRVKPVWKSFALGGIIAILISAILWLPMAHFLPNFAKWTDVEFKGMQPLEYALLNLVIRDVSFYKTEILSKLPYPVLYANYIGWVPVLLVIAALRLLNRSSYRIFLFLLACAGLAFLVSSGVILKPLTGISPIFGGLRYASLTASLAVPPLLAIAGWSLDVLIRQVKPRLSLVFSGWTAAPLALNVTWLLLAFPLFWAVKSAYDFGHTWLVSQETELVQPYILTLSTPTTEWVALPFGEHYWVPGGLENGLKLAPAYRQWWWEGRDEPLPYREVRDDEEAQADPGFVGSLAKGVYLVSHPENEYASIQAGGQIIPCQAHATGGDIDVSCDSEVPGTLVVKENIWSGWGVRRDGARATLYRVGTWLAAEAPAGQHSYSFRYRPWDAPLGIAISLFGVGLAAALWRRPVGWLERLLRTQLAASPPEERHAD